jgi:tetratricopeptide (TPR) repeat protein/predicted ATPase
LQSRTPPAAPAIFFGRDDFVTEAVHLIKTAQPARLAILGTGGIGKTSTALAILHHLEVQSLFSKRQYFVSCEAATSTGLLLQAILHVLGVESGSKDPLTILHHVLMAQSAPLMLVLDNFETPWDESDNQTEVESVISRVSAVPHVTLIITMRGIVRPSDVAWTQPPLAPLSPLSLGAARQTFLRVNLDKADSQPELDELLQELECVPLAVKLIAQLAQYQSCSSLLEQWRVKYTTLLHTHGSKSTRLNSVGISISLSLRSFPMTAEPETCELLSLLAHLPDGVPSWQENLTQMAPGFLHLQSLVAVLLQVALVYVDASSTLRTLSPIRHYMLQHHVAKEDNIKQLEHYYADFAVKHCKVAFGTTFSNVKHLVEPEIGNFTGVMLYALHNHTCQDVVQAIYDMAHFMYQASISGSLLLITKILPYIPGLNMEYIKPQCYQLMANILHMHDKYLEAQEMFDKAQAEFILIGGRHGVAQCMLSLSNILHIQAKYLEAEEKLEMAHAEFVQIGGKLGAAQCLQSISNILCTEANYSRAEEKLETAHSEFVRIGGKLGAAQCLLSLGNILRMQDKYAKAEEMLEKAHVEFIQIGDQHGVAQCVQSLGDVLHMQDKYPEAKIMLETAYAEFVQIGDQHGATQCVQSLGDILYMQDMYPEAEEKLEAAHADFVQIGERLRAAQCLLSLGNILYMQAKYSDAKMKLAAAHAEFAKIGDRHGAAQCLQSLGGIMYMLDKFPEAKMQLETAHAEFVQFGDRLGAAHCLLSFSDILCTQTKYPEAQKKLKAAHTEFVQIGSHFGVAQCIERLGNIKYMEKNYTAAQEMFKAAHTLFTQLKHQPQAAWCLKCLGEACQADGKTAEAKESVKMACSLYCTLENQEGITECLEILASLASNGI